MSKPIFRRGLTLMELVMVLVILVALAGILVPMMTGLTSNAEYTTTKATMVVLRNAIVAYNQDMKLPAAWATAPSTPPGTSGIPQTLKDLMIQPTGSLAYNPVTGAGWRGPYLLQATGAFSSSLNSSFYPTTGVAYGAVGDPAFLDGWGNPIVLQWPVPQGSPPDPISVYAPFVRLVSAGRPVPVTSGGKTTLQGQIVTPADTTGNAVPYQYVPTTAQRTNSTGMHNIVMFIFVQDPYPWTPTS